MAPDRLTRTFKDLTAQAGLPPIRLHDLRHGAATLALAAGVDLRTVQEMLGHASIVLTADTCTSVLHDLAHGAAGKVASLVLKPGCLIPPAAQHCPVPGRVGAEPATAQDCLLVVHHLDRGGMLVRVHSDDYRAHPVLLLAHQLTVEPGGHRYFEQSKPLHLARP